jgi:hypothetical protein
MCVCVCVCVCLGRGEAEALWMVDPPILYKCLNCIVQVTILYWNSQIFQFVRAKQWTENNSNEHFPLLKTRRHTNLETKHTIIQYNNTKVITASCGMYTSIFSYFRSVWSNSTLWHFVYADLMTITELTKITSTKRRQFCHLPQHQQIIGRYASSVDNYSTRRDSR